MNHWQRRILLGALGGVVLTMLFPPFLVHPGGNKVYFSGFYFLLSHSGYESSGTVDISLLLMEFFAIAIVCCILWMLKGETKSLGILARTFNLIEKNTNAKIEAAKEIAEQISEADSNARIEAAKITADAAIYTVNVQNKNSNSR